MTIISRFREANLRYVDELTPEKLIQVCQMKGINSEKKQKIIDQLADFVGLVHEPVKNTEEVFSTELVKALKKLDVNRVSEITFDKLEKILAGLGRRHRHRVIEELENCEDVFINDKQKIFLPLLPLGSKISKSPSVISLGDYKKFVAIYLIKHPTYPFAKDIIENLRNFSDQNWRERKLPSIVFISHALKYFEIDNLPDSEILQYSYFVQKQLLPSPISTYFQKFMSSLNVEVKEIFENRRMTYEPSTREKLSESLKISLTEVKKIDKKISGIFYDWWISEAFSLRLLIDNECRETMLSDYFGENGSALINNTIIKNNPKLKTAWLVRDLQADKIVCILRNLLSDGYSHEWEPIEQLLKQKECNLDKIALALSILNYEFSQNGTIVVSTRKVKPVEAIYKFCVINRKTLINNSMQMYLEILSWAEEKYGYKAINGYQLYKDTLTNDKNFICLGNGTYKLFNSNNYDLSLFKNAKDLLDLHFSKGIFFVSFLWLLLRIQKHKHASMKDEEFCQVFKRFYPDDFVYNDQTIFVKGSKPISFEEQIKSYLQSQGKPCSVQNLIQQFGWRESAINQVVDSNADLLKEGSSIAYLDFEKSKQIIGPGLVRYLNSKLDQCPVLATEELYRYYNENMADQISDTGIYNLISLLGFVSYLIPELKIVQNTFILKDNELSDIDKIWPVYLSLMVTSTASKRQLEKIALNAGMSEIEWNQKRRSYIKHSELVLISVDRFTNKDKINRSPETDRVVESKLIELFKDRDFISIDNISSTVWEDLPDVGFDWTQELFATYSNFLGYQSFSWEKRLRIPCTVITDKHSDYQSIEDVLFKQIEKWRVDNPNNVYLYERAMEVGLVPYRTDVLSKNFPKHFLHDKNLRVNIQGDLVNATT